MLCHSLKFKPRRFMLSDGFMQCYVSPNNSIRLRLLRHLSLRLCFLLIELLPSVVTSIFFKASPRHLLLPTYILVAKVMSLLDPVTSACKQSRPIILATSVILCTNLQKFPHVCWDSVWRNKRPSPYHTSVG